MKHDRHFASSLTTERLTLAPATQAHIRAELESVEAFAAIVRARVPSSWPPGQYDRDAQEFFLARFDAEGPDAAGWYGWYAVLRDEPAGGATVIGAGGYFGRPTPEGVVEIGYSVCPEWTGRGFATEMARALTEHALAQPGVVRVIAHARETNAASIAVLARCGFTRSERSLRAGETCFERPARPAG